MEAEEQFFHNEEFEEFSGETLSYDEAVGTETIFTFEKNENRLNYIPKGNRIECDILEKMQT